MTKYCQYFISNQECSNSDCLYLHSLVEEDYQGFGDIPVCGEGVPKEEGELILSLLKDGFKVFEEIPPKPKEKGSLPSIAVGLSKIKRFLKETKTLEKDRQISYKKSSSNSLEILTENPKTDNNIILIQQKINWILNEKTDFLSIIEKSILRNLLQSLKNLSRQNSRFNFAVTNSQTAEEEKYKYILKIINPYLSKEEQILPSVREGRVFLNSPSLLTV